jgi:hypothetical protein
MLRSGLLLVFGVLLVFTVSLGKISNHLLMVLRAMLLSGIGANQEAWKRYAQK